MNYPFRLPPYNHQAVEFEISKDLEARALLWQMRTGKTKVIIDTACYRFSIRKDIDAVLVLAPNGVHSNWVRRELPAHGWLQCNIKAHRWETRASRENDLAHQQSLRDVITYKDGLAVLAVNSEALRNPRTQKAIKEFIKNRRVMLVVDESHDFRTPGSTRTKLARGLATKCVVRRILTGTAVDNSPLAAYSQFELLHHGALGFDKFEQFKDRYSVWKMKRTHGGRSYPTLESYRNLDELRAKMAHWSSVVLREDLEDLPPLMPVEVTVDLSDAISDVFQKLKQEFIIDIEGEERMSVVEVAVRMTKLQQVLSGWYFNEQGEAVDIVTDDENPRLNALSAQIAGTTGKLIIWCRFRPDIQKVCARLKRDGIGHVEYHGGISSASKRDQAIDAFMLDPAIKVFVGQPMAGGSGLNLSAAEAIVWFSHTFDLIVRNQANERATQIGGRSIALVDMVTPSSVDGYILENHARKREDADFVAGSGLRDLIKALKEMDP